MKQVAGNVHLESWGEGAIAVLNLAACIDFSVKASKSTDLAVDKLRNGYPADLDAVIVCTAGSNHGVFQQMNCQKKSRMLSLVLTGVAICGAFTVTGCQVSVGGQTLPSAFYSRDDIQYFPKGSEFKLQREAAAQKAARLNNELNR